MQLPADLLQAINHYLAGTATPEEQQLVYHWYHSFKDDSVEIPVTIIELKSKVGERVWNRLERTLQAGESEPVIPVIPFYRSRWLRIAAVAMLFIVAGMYLYRGDTPQKNVTAPTAMLPVNDVAPGGDKAVLTLADGTQIVLDSAADGMLSQQGTISVVKTADGQLTYNRTGNPGANEVLYNTMSTPRGGQYKLTLSDGTEVWLNASSGIRYPTSFHGLARTVEIFGEVYFKVTKNTAMPFHVIIAPPGKKDTQPSIEVCGTQFNVMAYDDEAVIKTTLLEGLIKVVNGQPATGKPSSVMVTPGQQALMGADGNVKVTGHADVEEATAWINGLFQFTNTDIKTLMRQLSRWYDIEVQYEGAIRDMQITGKAPRNISLASMLKILALSDVKYKIEGRTLTVMP